VALRVGASAPPTISVAWCANNLGGGSPIVTTTDGNSEPVVWTAGAEFTDRLYAFNGETGEVLFSGGGPDEQMSPIRHFQTPIAVDGRIFVAADDGLYAFTTQ
jgi:outer membrane protein assembly factor BamB